MEIQLILKQNKLHQPPSASTCVTAPKKQQMTKDICSWWQMNFEMPKVPVCGEVRKILLCFNSESFNCWVLGTQTPLRTICSGNDCPILTKSGPISLTSNNLEPWDSYPYVSIESRHMVPSFSHNSWLLVSLLEYRVCNCSCVPKRSNLPGSLLLLKGRASLLVFSVGVTHERSLNSSSQ